MKLQTYRLLSTAAIAPLVPWMGWRMWKGKECRTRWRERWGIASHLRPPGRLYWVHGASVGESIAALPLIRLLLERDTTAHVLPTTGTTTSADVLSSRLPERTLHQYIPMDSLPLVQRFLKYWQPDFGIFMESELWPSLLAEAQAHRIPMVLVNGRMSESSFQFWQKRAPSLARHMVQSFRVVLAQGRADAERFAALGASESLYVGNLKYDAPALPSDAKAMGQLIQMIGDRHVWVAASTHPGEEKRIAKAHQQLTKLFADTLTIIIPRHASRGDAIASELRGMGLKLAQRSRKEEIQPHHGIYLADTMGELGLFYRLCAIVFMGGSLVPHGGQNPLEAARLECAVLCGKHMHNFADIVQELQQDNVLLMIENEAELAHKVGELLSNHSLREQQVARTMASLKNRGGVLQRIFEQLQPMLPPLESTQTIMPTPKAAASSPSSQVAESS